MEQTYPGPENEEQRLDELRRYALLDTPCGPALDRITRLASRTFDVPIALVSLVDGHRLRPKSAVGLSVRELQREITLCAHVVAHGTQLFVPDARSDPRFAATAAVTGPPGIRFYAGQPLTTPAGHHIGVLGLIDTRPRRILDEGERGALADLAAIITDRLELRRLGLAPARESEARLRHMAHRDPLTGLANRTLFGQRLRRLIEDHGRIDRTAALLLIDLDRFRGVNESLGHVAGDRLLVEVAARLRRQVREDDTVARIEGGRFAVVLAGLDDPAAAAWFAAELISSLSRPYAAGGRSVELGASIGIALLPADGREVDALMTSADLALTRARTERPGSYQFFAASMRDAVESRRRLERDLQRAVRKREFELFYQPQVRLADRMIVGAEALIRWRHPSRGLLPPAAFLDALEGGELAGRVGDWVVRTACAQLAAWQAQGLPPLRVGINLSRAHFRLPGIVDAVEQALSSSGVRPGSVELEVTESILLRHDRDGLDLLRQLHALGVRIAFDDFGTGHASLGCLKRFPLDRIKIDRHFVRHLDRDRDNAAIVGAVVGLGHGLGLEVIAEGIESAAEEALVRDFGCDEGQGFRYGRPMPADELARAVRYHGLIDLAVPA